MDYRVSVVIEHDEHGYYAWTPELPGCQSQGDTFEEISANIREAVEVYLETLEPEERRAFLKKELLMTSVEVALA